MQNMVDVGRLEGGLRGEGIFRYFLCSIHLSFFVYLLTPTGHTKRPITTVYGSKRVLLRKVSPFVSFDDKKIMLGGQNSQKT